VHIKLMKFNYMTLVVGLCECEIQIVNTVYVREDILHETRHT